MRNLYLLLLLVLHSCMISAQSSSYIEEARRIVSDFVSENNIPGLSISVYHDGEIIWSEGFGYADLELAVPVQPDKTRFRIGSVSKTLTASALGQLMSQNAVDLDAPIQRYVPAFPKKKYDITIRQLAGHLAGIRHYLAGEFLSAKRYNNVNEALTIFAESPLLFEPGTKYQYSSYGYNLVSAAIEILADKPFLAYMDEVVFDPLEMTSTCADANVDIIPNRTSFYSYTGSKYINAPYVDNSNKWAGGGFLSTTEDLIRFGVAHLSSGYLEQGVLDELMAPQSLTDGQQTKYGMGWRAYSDEYGRSWIGHGGGSVGGTTIFIMSKDEKMVIAMCANRGSIRYGDIQYDVANIFLTK